MRALAAGDLAALRLLPRMLRKRAGDPPHAAALRRREVRRLMLRAPAEALKEVA